MVLKICFVGNCQTERLAFLAELRSSNLQVLAFKSVHTLAASDREACEKLFAEADLILSQLISDEFPHEWVRTSYLQELFANKTRTFTNIYFIGYDPSWCYLVDGRGNRVIGPMDGGHFRPNVDTFVGGGSVDDAIGAWIELDRPTMARIQLSLDELQRRDVGCDIKLSKLVESRFLSHKILHTMHHPTL